MTGETAGVGPPADEAVDLSAAVAAAQRGDEESFERIYRAVQPRLLRYLFALVGGHAEDVAAEAWLQIVRDLPKFRGDYDGFRGWATTVARHRALDHVRRTRCRPAGTISVEEFGDLAGEADTAGSALDAMATRRAIRLIASLPKEQAEAVLLRVVLGLDTVTAAQVLGKRVGAVRTAAYRGLRRLAERLDEAQPRPSGRSPAPAGAAVTSEHVSALQHMRKGTR